MRAYKVFMSRLVLAPSCWLVSNYTLPKIAALKLFICRLLVAFFVENRVKFIFFLINITILRSVSLFVILVFMNFKRLYKYKCTRWFKNVNIFYFFFIFLPSVIGEIGLRRCLLIVFNSFQGSPEVCSVIRSSFNELITEINSNRTKPQYIFFWKKTCKN